MNWLRHLWNDPKELKIFAGFLLLFPILFFVEVRPELSTCFNPSWWFSKLLIHDGTQKMAEALLTGLISAYLFYFFVEFLPKKREAKKIASTLNILLESVLGSYDSPSLLSWASPPLDFHRGKLVTSSWLDAQNVTLDTDSKKIKCLVLSAHNKLNDFRFSLPMAASISTEHAHSWLTITAYLQKLAEIDTEQDLHVANANLYFLFKEIKKWLALNHSI